MKLNIKKILEQWRGVRTKEGFHRAILFLCFILVATLLWAILSLNDSVTETFDVRVKIENVPDSITFINDPPSTVHVTVKDKGTNLVRNGWLNKLHMNFNFRDFADNGIFHVGRNDFSTSLKAAFGNSAQITSSSVDSLYLHYTSEKGRRVPVVVVSDVTTAPGFIMANSPVPSEKGVLIFAEPQVGDTISRVYTEPVVYRNLENSTEVEVAIRPISGVKIVPSKVKVKLPIEPLVKKESMVTISVDKMPEGKTLLLFPNMVRVEYYTPMSLYNSDLVPVDVTVDFQDVGKYKGNNLPVHVTVLSDYVAGVKVLEDSVEYALQNN